MYKIFISLILTVLSLQFSTVVNAAVSPNDVFKKVAEVRANIEAVRKHFNKPANSQAELDVTSVGPREAFSQSLTLQKKVNQLSFEQFGRENDYLIMSIKGDIKPRDVLAIVNDTQKTLTTVMNDKGISTAKINTSGITGKSPTDVLKSVAQANRQLNLILEKKVSPGDVYQKVEEAINYAIVLRGLFPDAKMPAKEKLVDGKVPADVYNRLIKCFKLQREILQASDINVMKISDSVVAVKNASPSDVYDLASLVNSEITVAYLAMKNRSYPDGAYFAGVKKPNQVYQLAGVLEELLKGLSAKVMTDKNWLSRKASK